MVSMAALALYAMPAVVSCLVTAAAWWVSPGRRTRWWWTPAALVIVISGGLGALAYIDHAVDVSGGRALGGAALAATVTAAPLSVYAAMGRFIRATSMLVISWIASQMLLYPYALFALVYVIAQTQCGPGATDCPFG
jgi:hypothetical protein